jgi:hypothetical protein
MRHVLPSSWVALVLGLTVLGSDASVASPSAISFSRATAIATATAAVRPSDAAIQNSQRGRRRRRLGHAPVPGRNASVRFSAEATATDNTSDWEPLYVWQTTSRNATAGGVAACGYFDHLNLWSASWVTLEVPEPALWPVLLRLRRLPADVVAGGDNTHAAPPTVSPGNVSTNAVTSPTTTPTTTAARVHPVSSGATVVSVDPATGDVVVRVPRAAHFHVDLSPGGFDDVDTGPSYSGPPMHSFHAFVLDADQTAPRTDGSDPTVLVLQPGDPVPATGSLPSNSTVYFAPGVHLVPRDPATQWRTYTLQAHVRCVRSIAIGQPSSMNEATSKQYGKRNQRCTTAPLS